MNKNNSYYQGKIQNGFTLIEIMIVVAMMGILASIAVPSYYKQVEKSRRSDGKAALIRIQQQQETYFTLNNSYAQSLKVEAGGLGLGDPVYSGESRSNVNQDQRYYQIGIIATDSQGGGCSGDQTDPCVAYTLRATPRGSQLSDAFCADFLLSDKGVKNTQTPAHAEECWK